MTTGSGFANWLDSVSEAIYEDPERLVIANIDSLSENDLNSIREIAEYPPFSLHIEEIELIGEVSGKHSLDSADVHNLRRENITVFIRKEHSSFLSKHGFEDWLRGDGNKTGVLFLSFAESPIVTYSVQYYPFGAEVKHDFQEWPGVTDPTEVVRVLGQTSVGVLPINLGAWILCGTEGLADDDAAKVFARIAGQKVFACLGSDLESRASEVAVVFRSEGRRLEIPISSVSAVDPDLYYELMSAAKWIYSDWISAQVRSEMFGYHFVREHQLSGVSYNSVNNAHGAALEAFSLYLGGISRTVLEAATGLQSKLNEEVGKVRDHIGASVAGLWRDVILVFGVVTLHVVTEETPTLFLRTTSVIVSIVIAASFYFKWRSGRVFLALDADIRATWRNYFYSFIDSEKYEKIVEGPLKKAREEYDVTLTMVGIAYSALVGLLLFFAFC